MKNKIAFRLMLAFLSALLIFSLVIGGVFIALFRSNTMNAKKTELETRAKSIAATLSSVNAQSGTGKGKNGGGMSGGGAGGGEQIGYGVLMRYMNEISGANVWVVDQSLQLITSRMGGRQYHYSDLPRNAEEVVQEVFKGNTTFSEDFSTLLNAPTLTVGTPIMSGGAVAGAVLLHSPVQGITEVTTQGTRILLVSLFAALALSLLLSAALAYNFTKPLRIMKRTAVSIASGDYSARTGIIKRDEIGELAEAIDTMSGRLHEARLESEKLERLRREFVANISHELKTPVTVLRGSLEALCDEVVTEPGQVKSYHSQMLAETLYLQRLINDLLDLSRLQNTDFKIEASEINLGEVLRDSVHSAGRLAAKKDIEIREKLDEQFFRVTGDYGRLRQMFLIILDNAVKFSPPGSEITVSLENGTVSVSDSGVGIPEKELPYIFDRFYKTKSEENKSGSGLGLAIAKQIAERHGVTISVESRESEGTTFRFHFRNSDLNTNRL